MSATKTHLQPLHPQAFEEAHDALVRLGTLKKFLTPADEETLAILADKELLSDLEESFSDERKGNVYPLESIR